MSLILSEKEWFFKLTDDLSNSCASVIDFNETWIWLFCLSWLLEISFCYLLHLMFSIWTLSSEFSFLRVSIYFYNCFCSLSNVSSKLSLSVATSFLISISNFCFMSSLFILCLRDKLFDVFTKSSNFLFRCRYKISYINIEQ